MRAGDGGGDDGGGGPRIRVLPMDGGGEPERSTGLPFGAGAPVWSPDGRRVAFTDGLGLRGDLHRHVHVMDLDRGDVRHPCAPVTGIHTVVLGGVPVVVDGTFTGERRGQVLRSGAK